MGIPVASIISGLPSAVAVLTAPRSTEAIVIYRTVLSWVTFLGSVRLDHSSKPSRIVLLLGSAASFATVPLFATWLTMEGVGVWFQIAARLAFSSLVLVVLRGLFASGSARVTGRRTLLFLVLNGLLVLVVFATYLLPLSLGTPPTKLILLSYLSPVYVALLGTRFLGERLTAKKLGAMAIGVAGTALTIRVWEVLSVRELHPGDLLALANGFLYATMIVVGRRAGVRERMRPLAFTLWSFVFALVWLIVLGMIAMAWLGPSVLRAQWPATITPRIAGHLAGLVLVATLLPVALLYAGLKHTEAGSASIVMLSEPICVFVLSFLFLDQPIGWWQFAGGAAILSAGLLVAR